MPKLCVDKLRNLITVLCRHEERILDLLFEIHDLIDTTDHIHKLTEKWQEILSLVADADKTKLV